MEQKHLLMAIHNEKKIYTGGLNTPTCRHTHNTHVHVHTYTHTKLGQKTKAKQTNKEIIKETNVSQKPSMIYKSENHQILLF